ncbi:MAG: tetratricopeptide repeat protein, partial [Planctomycetota bacterium]|nr:tetratricopeptide repeat protein [Planctomycetota bacterium]
EGAVEDYTRAIALNPRYAEAYVNRGNKYGSQGNLRAALADFEKALGVAPANWRHRKVLEKKLAEVRKLMTGK